MVHQGLVLELALEVSRVADAVPRFYADERSQFAVWTPEGADRCLVFHRHCRFARGIYQHGTVRLALVNLHRVVAEEVVADFQHTPVSLQGHLHHVVATVGIALQHIHRLLVVQLDHPLQFSARHVKGRVSAYLEVNLAAVRVLHMPDDVYLVALQTIGNGQVETVRIHLQRLLRFMQRQCHFLLRLSDDGKLRVACKPMTRQMILLPVDHVCIIVHTTDDRKQYGRMSGPLLPSLPHILSTLAVLHTLEFGSHFGYPNRQHFILQFNHSSSF